MSNDLALSASAKPTLGGRIHNAGVMALASFSGPAAGVIGCAAMYGSAMLVSKWTGNNSGQSLQGLQGMLAVASGALLAMGCVATTCLGAINGFVGGNPDHAAPLGSALKESAIIAASGVGIAAATGATIMGLNTLSHVFQATNNPWLAAPVAAAALVTGLLSISGSIAGPLGMGFASFDATSKAFDGCDLQGAPVANVGSKLRHARQVRSEQSPSPSPSLSPFSPRMA